MTTLYATKGPAEPEGHDTLTRKSMPRCLFKWRNLSEIHSSRCIVHNCLRKTLPEIDMCVICFRVAAGYLGFSLGDRSEWVRGWSLHLLSPSLWSFHTWHIRLWPRLLKTRHLSSIILFSCLGHAIPVPLFCLLVLETLGPEPPDLRRDHERSYVPLLL